MAHRFQYCRLVHCRELAYTAFKQKAHTLQGVIAWPRLLQSICARATWFFNVPVGDSGARAAYLRPHFPLKLAAGSCISSASSAGSHLAKLLVYALRADDLTAGDAAANAQSEEAQDTGYEGNGKDIEDGSNRTCEPMTAMQGIKTFCLLLEHYFHANANGRCVWPPIWSAQPSASAVPESACTLRSAQLVQFDALDAFAPCTQTIPPRSTSSPV